MKTILRILFAICAVFLFRGMLACGGGSATGAADDSGSTDALTIAERISVVDAQEDRSPQVSAFTTSIRDLQRAVADLPADSDYMTDEQHVWVHERSAETFDIINEILCMMNQTAYAEMINAGPYIAQIDIGQCESKDNASAAGQSETDQSSGSTMTEYEFWTINSYRNSGEPHYVEVWVHQGGDEFEPAMDIDVLVAITEAASEANPLGIFTMNFEGTMSGDGPARARTDEPGMRGILRTSLSDEGLVELQFVDQGFFGDGFDFREAATLYKSPDGSSGSGSVTMSETDPFGTKEMEGDFAFDANYFLRSNEGDSICLSRTSFDETTWNYGVYDAATGNRIERNSGFSIHYEDYWGWAGYYGLWLPDDVFNDLVGGETVYKIDYQSDGPPTETPYTVFKAPGKLLKYIRQAMTLGEIAGIPIGVWRCDGEGEGSCGEYRVVFDGETEQLLVNGIRSQEDYYWIEMEPEAFVPNDFDWAIYGYAQALGGSVQINRFNSETGVEIPITSESAVIFHSEDVVTPLDTDIPELFVCAENCYTNDGIDPLSSYEVPFEETFSFHAMNGPLVEGQTHLSYGFDLETMTLTYNGEIVDPVDDSGEHPYGYWMDLVGGTDTDELSCPFEPYGTCFWKMWDTLDVYYSYETGPNPWNQYSTLQDSTTGEVVVFDPPLMLQYVHTTGTYYNLEYEGFPNLHGIPGKCFDTESGEDVGCEDSGDNNAIRWIPEFSIADDTIVTDMQDAEFLVKGIDKEQRMTMVDEALCSEAGLAAEQHELLDISEFVAPDIGEEPDVTDPPAVIAGEVQ